MTVNDRFALQQKNFPNEPAERFYPMNAVGSGSYSLTAPPRELLAAFGRFIYGARADANLITLYHSIPEIYSPIDQIARRVIACDIQLKRKADDEVVTDNKDWNRLYDQPNPLQGFKEFLYEAVTYKYVTGKNYAYKNIPDTLKGKLQNIVALWNLPADRVKPMYNYGIKMFDATSLDEIIQYYSLFDGQNTGQYATNKILHTKTVNLDWVDRRLVGKSPLLAADIALCNLIAVYEARNVIYTKKGALGAITSAKEDATGPKAMTTKERMQIREANNQEFGLTGGRDLYAIYDSPVNFVRFGMSIQELQPFDEATADMAALYAVLNVPFDLAPNAKGSTFDNQKGSMRSIYTNTVIPETNFWMPALTKFLGLDQQGLYLHADFSKIEELQENKKEKADTDSIQAKTNLTLFATGIITLNQWSVRQGINQSVNGLYDKLVFDMTPEELTQVTTILALVKPLGNGTGQTVP